MVKIILPLLMVSFGFSQLIKEQNIYGYIDLQYSQSITDKSNFAQPQFIDDISDVSLSHVNIYYDIKPNPNTRALIEIAYKNDFYNTVSTPEIQLDSLRLGNIDQNMSISEAYSNGLISAEEAATMKALEKQLLMSAPIAASEKSKQTGGVYIERAWFDLLFDPLFQVRIGRYVNPVGIWNVDHGSPVLITARQPLQMSIVEIYPLVLEGAMAYGSHYFGDHEFNYKLHISQGRETIDQRPKGFQDLGKGWRMQMNLDILDGISIGHSGYMGAMREGYFKNTPRVILSPEDVASIGQLYEDGQLHVDEYETYSAIIESSIDEGDAENVERVSAYSKERILGIDLGIQIGDFKIQGELNRMQANNLQKTSRYYKRNTYMTAYYGLMSYEFLINKDLALTPYILAEHLDFELNKNNPLVNFSIYPLNHWTNYFVGLNLNLWSNVFLKAEYTQARVNLDSDISSTFTPSRDILVHQFLTQFSLAF